jgi:hypothetical protein
MRHLRSGETTGGPAIGSVIRAEKSVLLLKTEPRLFVGICVHDLHAVMTEVVLVGSSVAHDAFCQDNDVWRATERIRVDGARAEVNVGVVTGGLVRGGTIEVPDGKVRGLVVLLRESLIGG